MRRDVYQAIADPNRRAILHLLARQTLTLNGLAANFDISRPAISKHVKILSQCGLVKITKHGRERVCEAQLQQLDEVAGWVEHHRTMWNARLDRLETYLTTLQRKDTKNARA